MKYVSQGLFRTGLILCGCLLFQGNSLASSQTPNQESIRELSLYEAIQEAMMNNLGLKLKKEQLVEAVGSSRAAEGIFDTTLTGTASRGNTTTTPLIVGAVEEEDTTFWSAGLSKTFTPGTMLSLSWDNSQLEVKPQAYLLDPAYSSGINLSVTQPLLQGFGIETQTAVIRATRKQQEASALIVESTSADLAAEVIKSYWDLVFSWQDIEVKQVSLKLAQKLLKETQERIDAGKLADVEIFRPQSEMALREERLIFAERAIGLAEDQVKVLLNSDEWGVGIVPSDRPDISIKKFNVKRIQENTLKNRPDLKAARLNTESAKILMENARDKTRSSLSLFGAIGIAGTDDSYGDSLDNLASDSDTSWQIGLTFSRPLDNTLAKGRLIQAEAVVNQSRTATEIMEQEMRRAVRATLRDVDLAIKNMEATQKTTLASSKGLEAEQVKFKAGRGTTLDVLVAQERYSTALSQENLAKISYVKTLAELDRLQGRIPLPVN